MKKTALLLSGIMALAIFFRLFSLTATPPGLYPDEAMDGNNALEALSTHQFKVFYPENNGREGLFMNIQALFLAALKQNEPWVLRLPSAIFGILTVFGLYFLTKELFKNSKLGDTVARKIALLASFLIATSFWHINFSRISFRAIMAPFFAIWTVYFLIKSFGVLESKKSILNSIIGGLFFGLGFYSYIAYRPLPLLTLIVMLLYWFRNKDGAVRKKIATASASFVIITFFTALPLGLYFLHNPGDFFGRTSEISVFGSGTPFKDLGLNILKTAGMFNIAGDGNWRHNISGAPELFWPVGILFLIGVYLTLRNIFKKSDDKNLKSAALILTGWIFLTALPVVISNEGLPHALRSILMIPPVFILAAWGGLELYEWLKNLKTPKNLLIIGFCTLFILMIVQTYYSYFIFWGQKQETKDAFAADYVEVGRKLNSLPQTLSKYVIVQAKGVLVRGIPMPAQTVMFITNTYLPQAQTAKNIHYILPNQTNQIPQNSAVFTLN